MLGISKRRIPAGSPGAGVVVLRVHYSADPTMTPEKVAGLKSTYTSPARWEREMEIAYEALEGQRFIPEFKREVNVCPSFDVSNPEYWTMYMACDPHPRTPHAFAWRAFNKYGDHVVCGELWPGQHYSVAEYSDAVDLFESDSERKPTPFEWANGKKLTIQARYMDTFGKGANSDEGPNYFETYGKYGLFFQPANKSQSELADARDEIGRQLLPIEIRSNEQIIWRPRMNIFENCHECINEMERVRYPEGEAERPSHEKPLTYRKHVIDCVIYIQSARPRFIPPRRQGSNFEPIYPNLGR